MNNQLDICAIFERSRLSAFQMLVLGQCFLCMAVDGFDIQAMAYAAPSLIAQWGIPIANLGPVFSISMLGMLIGSLALGAIADRVGRRPALVSASLTMAVLMYLTAQTTTVDGLLALRFFTGIAMGAIVPNAATLVTEYAPGHNRVMLLTLVSSGLVVGGLVGGALAAALIPQYGWQVVFYLGAFAPLCVGVIMLFALPESLQWCVLRERQLDRVRAILTRIEPGLRINEQTRLLIAEPRRKGLSLAHLFADGRLPGTLLLWLINFMNMLCIYFLASWTPVLMSGAGHTPSQAVLAGTSMWLGGLAGGWLLGWFVDRHGFGAVLVPTFIVSAVAIVLFSHHYNSINLAYLTIAVAGFGILGGQAALNAMTSTFYPTALRATGTGWTLGLGRLGGICGPFVGATLLHLQWSTSELLVAAAIPASIAAIGIIGFWRLNRTTAVPMPN
ncbi:MFS transporter [Pseudomonas sp. CCI3.2]|uniref:MFS transporter n=1 Tax=unclassified Pseudomonas TaxID=196821 RepID=UPI002AC8FFF1|nr:MULTISPECIES: MFS transporter [unclassified Pseudomonas]MEB0079392.1 MFS transporter [Pseudomonas sp. MH10out]MEB0103746.1 MFS transporter [Pseudomonas sp. CCI3.2]MEB0132409.1 MFS transporter [Pseudomonas sp. CCI2.4]MEB0159691.1 MFS transporter [Pseudomonas sp. AH2 (2023)]MEB0169101.1 MFS transporter [Pseudomonas sp. CCC4.4]